MLAAGTDLRITDRTKQLAQPGEGRLGAGGSNQRPPVVAGEFEFGAREMEGVNHGSGMIIGIAGGEVEGIRDLPEESEHPLSRADSGKNPCGGPLAKVLELAVARGEERLVVIDPGGDHFGKEHRVVAGGYLVDDPAVENPATPLRIGAPVTGASVTEALLSFW